jgi:hypothetical protein
MSVWEQVEAQDAIDGLPCSEHCKKYAVLIALEIEMLLQARHL